MLGIPVLLAVVLLIMTVVLRWRLRNEEANKAEVQRLLVMASQETAMAEVDAVEEYRSTEVLGRHQCAVCYSYTSGRCSRCKAVRYCSSKCQIIHWRQGHKYECHPQVPRVFERQDLMGNAETADQWKTNGIDSADGSPMMNAKRAIGQNDLSDSHTMTPRLSTVTVDSLENTIEPTSEHERPVVDINYPKMVQLQDRNMTLDLNAPLTSRSIGSVNSVKKLKKDKSKQNDRVKTMASTSDLPPRFRNDNPSEGAVSGDLRPSKSNKVSAADLLLNEKQKHSQTFKYGEVKSLNGKKSGSSSLRARSGSSSSHLPYSGFKSSVEKVAQHVKASHHKKPPLRSSVFETLGNHNSKVVFQHDTFMKLYSSNEVELIPFGLTNCGNSCYANAVLQCLAYTRPLTSYLLQGLHSKYCLKQEWCFICEFEHLMLKARQGQSPLSPIKILSNISHLGHGREEDAHEFLRYAIDTMQSICVEQAGFAGPGAEETTLVGMTFGGYLHSKIKCMKCHNKSEKHERMMDLTVEIDGDVKTLEQALKRFTASEILEGDNKYHCSRCKSYEKAKKKLTVFQAPNILTIVLKRFKAGNFTKLNKPIQFPELLKLSPYMSDLSDRYPQYSLYAVVVHLDVMNAAFSGHYVCYVKNYHEEWFKIDDSVVIHVDLERVLSEEAYMLLYARQSPRAPVSTRNTCDGQVAFPSHRRGTSAIPNAGRNSLDVSADPLVMQHQSSGNGYAKPPSYLEEWVSHSVQSIPMVDSLSEVSSLFSNSEEGAYSTSSTKDSASVEDFSGYKFGRGGAAGC